MDINEFMLTVKHRVVPEEPPYDTLASIYVDDCVWKAEYEAKEMCRRHGMWAIVDMQWTKQLADWIGDRSVLEVMSGKGWLAKALKEHKVDITATDDNSWDDRHSKIEPLCAIIPMDGLEAVHSINADILLVSWPPYDEHQIVEICKAWGTKKPIIYIGEDKGGCCAVDEFFDHFVEIENQPHFDLRQWDGIHDYVQIGYWKE